MDPTSSRIVFPILLESVPLSSLAITADPLTAWPNPHFWFLEIFWRALSEVYLCVGYRLTLGMTSGDPD